MNVHKGSLKQNKTSTFMLNLIIRCHIQTKNRSSFEPACTLLVGFRYSVILEGQIYIHTQIET